MSQLQKAIEEIERKIDSRITDTAHRIGMKSALGILRRNLSGTAMVDVMEKDYAECIISFDSFGLERKCPVIGEDCPGIGNDGCPAYVTK